MKKRRLTNRFLVLSIVFIFVAAMVVGCDKQPETVYEWEELAGLDELPEENDSSSGQKETVEEVPEVLQEENSEAFSEEVTETPSEEEVTTETSEASETVSEEPTVTPPALGGGRLVVIDAGHQAKGNSEKEPVGPGATETKAKVTGGATGTATGQKEYELNLAVAFLLRDELVARGYEVIMVRESHDVNISNSERAMVANNAGADAFIRIHANGSENASASGTETLCQTAQNPYNAALHPTSRKLSEQVLAGVVAQTGFKNRGVKETDTMSGINWCTVPTTIVEMGFLSNPDEDTLMNTEEYRKKIAVGIADGIDSFFVE